MTKPIQIKNLTIGRGMPKVCVPLTADSAEKLYEEAKNAVNARADLVEWRADFYKDLSNTEKTTETLKGISDILGETPLLFTIRTKEEGGSISLSVEDYIEYTLNAARTDRADLVDVEVFGNEEKKKELIQEIHKTQAKVIASSHDFEKTDNRDILQERFMTMDQTGADILKMAVMPKEFDDVAAIMQVTNTMTEKTQKPLVSMSMGNLGSMSRIAGENFGSSITFATVGEASAPGQFPIKELRMMMSALHEKNNTEA